MHDVHSATVLVQAIGQYQSLFSTVPWGHIIIVRTNIRSSSWWQEESGCKHANKKTANWMQADPSLKGVFEDMPTVKVAPYCQLFSITSNTNFSISH